MKRALAILGDGYHAVAPLHVALVKELEKRDFDVDCFINYEVPFDDFSEYDLIVISRYAYDDVQRFKKPALPKDRGRWLTADQEEKFAEYASNGGNLFIHHDGFGFYRKGGGLARAAKSFFITHPPIGAITVKPINGFDELNAGVEPYEIFDEEYQVEMDESETNVFLESFSEANGRHAQGWFHDFGKGKVVVFIPEHDKGVLSNPMVKQGIGNVIDWLAD